MEIKLAELAELLSERGGSPNSMVQTAVVRDLGTQIVVADRGFVYVGKVSIDVEMARITNARNIRVWGTTKGLGELVNGPTSKTALDEVGEVLVPMKAVIHFIKCSRDW